MIDSPAGAFGTGAHPTTRMCLELLLDLEPAGGFADLGCGAGLLAIAAAALGYRPVFAVDHEARSVEATRRNAERNGVEVEALQLDLLDATPPPAPTLAANVPPAVHRRARQATRAGGHPCDRVRAVASTAVEDLLGVYGAAGFDPIDQRGGAWRAVLLERRR